MLQSKNPTKLVKSTKSPATNQKQDNSGLTNAIHALHLTIYSLTQIPEIQLEEEEAQRIACALSDFTQAFGIEPNEKMQAITNLVFALGGTYTAKYFMYKMRIDEEKEKEKAKQKAIEEINAELQK